MFREAGIGRPVDRPVSALEAHAPLRLTQPTAEPPADRIGVPSPFYSEQTNPLAESSVPTHPTQSSYALYSPLSPEKRPSGSWPAFSSQTAGAPSDLLFNLAPLNQGAEGTAAFDLTSLLQNDGSTWPRLSDIAAQSSGDTLPLFDPTHDALTATGRIPVNIVQDSMYPGHKVVEDAAGQRATVPVHRLETRAASQPVPNSLAHAVGLPGSSISLQSLGLEPYENIPPGQTADPYGPLMSYSGEWPHSVDDYAMHRRRRDPDDASDDTEILKLFDGGMGYTALANRFDSPKTWIIKRLLNNGRTLRTPEEANALHATPVDKSRAIIQAYKEGVLVKAIAGEYGVHRNTVTNIAIRENEGRTPAEARALAQRMGRINTRGIPSPFLSTKTGELVHASSSYEVVRMHQLDNDPAVVRWWKSADVIPYMFNGEQHGYHPDIHVIYDDGSHVVEEVKPANLVGDPQIQAKALAAQAYYNRQGFGYRFVTENDIGLDTLRNFDYDSLASTSLSKTKAT